MSAEYEVFAVKYGAHTGRPMNINFIDGDPHDTSGAIAYYVWLIRGHGRTVLVDTGMTKEAAASRGRTLDRLPREGLEALGVSPREVQEVVVTHLHFDHAGTLGDWENARFHLQDEEMDCATGRLMCHERLRHPYDVEDVCTMVRKVYKDEVCFHCGDAEIAPGISVHHIGGHAKGLMSVRVNTRRGHVVLASDAAHLYANMEQQRPFPILYNLGDMLEGWKKLHRLADSPRHIVPGHDPLVMQRYEAAQNGMEDLAVRLDQPPKE